VLVGTPLGTEFTALLAHAGVSQATFARLTGTTARQVNNWCRGRASVPAWAAALAILMQDTSPEAIQIRLEEVRFSWHKTLGVPPNAEAGTVRRAMARLALATPTRAALRRRWPASMEPMIKPSRS
jgi:transcriptional regulator with XRE-family HTH domain